MKTEIETEVIKIKTELHRMLYSEDFNTIEALKDGIEKLNSSILTGTLDDKAEIPDMNLREAAFLARTEGESFFELKRLFFELTDMRGKMEKLHKTLFHMVSDKEIEIYRKYR